MPEGFDAENPTTRGRRSPEISAMLDAEEEMRDAGDEGDPDVVYMGLFPGDPVIIKVTLFAKTPLGDAWFTAGTQTRVADGETSDMAFDRVSDVITDEVMKFGQKQIDAIESVQQELEQTPPPARGRITPR